MFRRVGVTIQTTVETSVVSTDVDAFNATAHVPLIFVFPGGDRVARDPFYQFPVDAHPGGNTHVCKVYFHGTRVQ